MCTLLCFSIYKAQFLNRMGRLLDNLPEKDVSTASQCTTPCVQSSSTSLTQMHSAHARPRNLPVTSNCTELTTVTSLAVSCESSQRDMTFSVQSTSTTNQLETSAVINSGQCRVSQMSTSYQPSTCIAAQIGPHPASHNQFYNVCLANQQPTWSQTLTLRHLPLSKIDIFTNSDIPSSCITIPSNSGRNGPCCVTTQSSPGRGGLSAYDGSSHRVNSTSVEGFNKLTLSCAPPSHTSSRPLVDSNRQRTPTTRSVAAYSDWITTRN